MKILFPALLLVVIISCGQNKKKSVQSLPSPPVVNVPAENNAVTTYTSFINNLDTTKVASVSIAVRQFEELFSKSDTLRADSAFVIFSSFYDRMLNYLNEQHLKDGTDYTAYVTEANYSKGKKTFSADTFVRNLNENGFAIDMTEGVTYIKQDRSFLSRYFYIYVSQTMKEYLVQVDKEKEEGFVEDAGLEITPVKLCNRILFWESFIKRYPSFPFTAVIKQNQKGYITFLLEGIDNTPLIDIETKKLSPDFQSAFDYILTNSAQSDLAGLVKPYYNALRNNDIKTVRSLLLKYKKQGIIYDYSA